jgi:Phage integrase family
VALPAQSMAALTAHRAAQATERRLAGDRRREHGLVVPDSVGTPLEARNLLRHCQETCEKLGLPRFTLRQLRHTAATFLLAQGVPLKVAQAILGHSQLALTADVYTHVTPELHAEAAARQDALLRRLGAAGAAGVGAAEAVAEGAAGADRAEGRDPARYRAPADRPKRRRCSDGAGRCAQRWQGGRRPGREPISRPNSTFPFPRPV